MRSVTREADVTNDFCEFDVSLLINWELRNFEKSELDSGLYKVRLRSLVPFHRFLKSSLDKHLGDCLFIE